jgi:pimeloyl-ACP methyl ester carboxylesterase
MSLSATEFRVRVHGSGHAPTLIYLPGIHGDGTLISGFRHALGSRARFVEVDYPRTTTLSIASYAQGIETTLKAAGIGGGWLLGESFGSQPAWELLKRWQSAESELQIDGIILAGGFVKHSWPCGARLLRTLTAIMPTILLKPLFALYALYSRWRHRDAPGMSAAISEFVTNRLHPDDPPALMHRCTLIAETDLRQAARQATVPVFQLVGLIDPIVPGPLVRRWLRKHCPTLRESHTLYAADHNVLASASKKAVAKILDWISRPPIAMPGA